MIDIPELPATRVGRQSADAILHRTATILNSVGSDPNYWSLI